MTQHLAIFITIQFTKCGFLVITSTKIVSVQGTLGPPMLPLVNFPINADTTGTVLFPWAGHFQR